MTVRPILHVGDPLLRQRSREVSREELASPQVQQLIDDLIDTMRDANGAGIAAPQVGELLRIAAIEVADNPRYPYKPRIPLTIVVNPVIEPLTSGQFEAGQFDNGQVNNGKIDAGQFDNLEGCLSVPNMRGLVPRWVNVRVRFLDRAGVEHDTVKRGLTAGTFQHECDHLDGVLFLDRVRDTRSLTTWDNYERFHRDAFVAEISEFVRRVGS